MHQDKLIAVRHVKSFLFEHFIFLLLFQWNFLMLRKLLCSSDQLRRGDLERVEEEGQWLRMREREKTCSCEPGRKSYLHASSPATQVDHAGIG